MNKPDIEATADGYRVTWDDGITATLEELREGRDRGIAVLTAVVTIESSREPRPGTLKWGPLNLLAEPTKAQWVKQLEQREPEYDWQAKMDQLAKGIRDVYRAGEQTTDLMTLPPRTRTRWLVEPFVETDSTSVVFADGGTGKSLAGIAIAITAASGVPIISRLWGAPVGVLYLDWETDMETTAERMQAVRTGAHITNMHKPIYYRRQVATLEQSAPEIKRQINDLGTGLVIVDSLGAARGGEPESADLTIRTFNAIRTLGVPALCIDHVTKLAGNDATKAFGSVYSHNLARLTWSMDKEQKEGADPTIVFKNRKRNNGRLIRTIAFNVHMEEEGDGSLAFVRYESTEVVNTALASRYASVKDRIRAAIRGGGMNYAELNAELEGLSEASLRARIKEMKDSGEVRVDDDHRFWLATREN